MDTRRYDAIVIGGGHNGLVAARLPRQGRAPAPSSSRPGTRRAAPPTPMAPWPEAPEFKVTTLSYVMSLMPDTILRDLQLERHGYRCIPVGPYFLPFPDGRCIVQSDDDAAKNYDEFAKFSKRDADAIERWDAWIGGLAEVLGPLLMTTPPTVGLEVVSSTCMEQLAAGVAVPRARREDGRRRHAPDDDVASCDILDRFFESDQVKTVMALNGLIGTWAGPHEPGTGYVMAHHSIGDVGDGHLGAWAVPEGGMGAVAAAIEASARSRSAPRSAPKRPRRADPHHERARARRRAGGRRGAPRAAGRHRDPPEDHVPATARPERAAGATSSRDIEHWSSRSGVVKINCALDRAAGLHANPEHHGSVPVASSSRTRSRTWRRRSRKRARGGRRRCRSATAWCRRPSTPRSRPRAST